MSSAAVQEALDAAKLQYAEADKAWKDIADEVAKSSPEVREELDALFAHAAEQRANSLQAVTDLQSEYIAETLLERYGEDQEAAICEGKTHAEAIELADSNLYTRMTGHEHMGQPEDLQGDIAWEMESRFGEEKAEAYEKVRGGEAQEQTIEQDRVQDPGIER